MARRFDVLAVGEVNVDLILAGLPRVPEFGTEVLASAMSMHLGGATANFSVFARRLGLLTAFVTRLGHDLFGDFLLEQLRRYDIPLEFIQRDEQLATGLTVSLSGPEDRAFVTHLGTIDSVQAADVPDDLLANCRHLHVSSYFLQSKLAQGLAELFTRAHAAGLTISLDPGYDPSGQWNSGLSDVLPLTDVFLPNEIEVQGITQAEQMEVGARQLGQEANLVVVKLGSQGCLAVSGDEFVHAPAYTVTAADTTCCGDGFNAGFLQAWLEGLPLATCLARGNAVGGLIATGRGSAADLLSEEAITDLMAD